MCRGDVLIAVDGNLVTGLSHGDVIHFMMTAARQGVVRLTLRRETGSNGSRLSQGQLHIQPQQLHDNASNSTCKPNFLHVDSNTPGKKFLVNFVISLLYRTEHYFILVETPLCIGRHNSLRSQKFMFKLETFDGLVGVIRVKKLD